jgi:hypothetical protein
MRSIRSNRWWRRAMHALGATGLTAALLLGASLMWAPTGGWATQYAHAGIRLDRGTLELTRCTHDVQWSGNSWQMSCPGSRARVISASSSTWCPNTTSARMLLTGPGSGSTLVVLSNVFIPLWPWAVLTLAGAAGLWWRLPKTVGEGCCARCGYDLRGIRGDKCPECGRGFASMIRLLLRARTESRLIRLP